MKKLLMSTSIILSLCLLGCTTSQNPPPSTVPSTIPSVIELQSEAKLKTQTIEYKDGDTILEGYLSYAEGVQGKRPGVLVVHEWTGLGDYAKKRADDLARLGYVAFAADIYGKGVRPTNPKDAGTEAGKYKSNRALMRSRVNAGFNILNTNEMTDQTKTAAMGYCFGGTTVLELARSGAPLNGFVSFHGGLDSPVPEDGKNIKGKVLILHGADDPTISEKDMMAFQSEMKTNKVSWEMISYGGAVHAFTNPASGNDNSKGAAYNENADKKSFVDMKEFFNEIFK